MKLSPEKIYTHFNTVRDVVTLDAKLKWFCVDPISLRTWNDTKPEYKHTCKITVYLMSPNGVSLASRQTASQLSGLMGSEIYDVQIAPVDNGLIKQEGHYFELDNRKIPSKVLETIPVSDIFHVDFMETKGFVVIEDNGTQGRAIDKNGWKVMSWNREGCNVSYLGEPMEKNSWLEIHMDGGTRRGFHGVVYSREQLEMLIDLTR